MKVATTLRQLRAKGACIGGYNKLVRSLQGEEFTEADEDRDSYIRFAHKEEIPIGFIFESNGLDDALWALMAVEQTPEVVRSERLYAVWCARQVQHLMEDERSINALDVAERHANGEATDEELAAARDAARDATWAAAWEAARAAARAAAWDATWAAAWEAAWAAARDAARAAARDAQKQKFSEVFCGESINFEALGK